MNIIFAIFVIALFLTLLRSVLFHVQAWQVKEYRVRRMIAALEEYKWRRAATHPVSLLTWILAIIFSTEVFAGYGKLSQEPILILLIILFYIGSGIYALHDFARKTVARPKPTTKALLLIVAGFVAAAIPVGYMFYGNIITTFFASYTQSLAIIAVILDRAVILGVLAGVLALKIPTRLAKERSFSQARQVRSRMDHLKVIGITGSYAKSSVKEFLVTILKSQYSILNTPENINTDIGIARLINTQLRPKHEVFVAEMGAYHTGEIAQAASIAKPTIGVMTGLNDQHISLFGSRENINKAKYEVIEALPENGIGVFNIDSPRVRTLYKKFRGEKISYGTNPTAHVKLSDFSTEKGGIKFIVSHNDESVVVHASVFGVHNALNITGAIATAIASGMKLRKSAKAAKKVQAPICTLEPIKGPEQSLVLDDSYSSNTNGVAAALEVLKELPYKNKIVLMPSVIELGKRADQAHEELAAIVGSTATRVYMLDQNHRSAIWKGAGTNSKKFSFVTPAQLQAELSKALDADTVVLITGRMMGAFKSIHKYLRNA